MNKKRFLDLYTNFLRRFLKVKRPIKVVFDCSNGVTGFVIRSLLKTNKLINFKLINSRPDGRFPAHGPNPLAKGATRQLEQEVKKQKADLGVIFDADGDRAFFVDNLGRFMDGDVVTRILIEELRLKKIVVDVNTGWLIKKLKVPGRSGKSEKLKVIISRTGTFFMKEAMRKSKAIFGAERSGHYYFRKFFNADSGILTAILLINRVSRMSKEELLNHIDSLPKYYRYSADFHFDEKKKKKAIDRVEKKYKNLAAKLSKLDGLSMEFCSPSAPSGQNFGEFWFNLRPSNTEPLLRLNVEADNVKILKEKSREITGIILS